MDWPNHHAVGRPPLALCHSHTDVKKYLPDFLVISPPKTGSTWLAANLRCHPGIFVPDVKEVKYFSLYHRWLDLNWYAGQFRNAGARLKGEASPSYALLPVQMIRWIHALMPHVKLVFLIRDPIARAWSHARHNYRYREASFTTYQGDIESVPDERWRESFRHPWLLGSGDYLGQLQRWLSVFPREQIYVDLYERIVTEPRALLQRMLSFLGVDAKQIDWPMFRIEERILSGLEKPLPPPLAAELRRLLHGRSCQLQHFLREKLGLSVSEAWSETLANKAVANVPLASAEDCHPSHEAFARAFDEEYLADLLATEVQSSDPQLIVEGYYEHNVVLHRGRFVALAQSLGEVKIEALHAAIACGRDSPGILLGNSLAHVKERVAEQVVSQGVRQLEHQQRRAEERIRELQHQVEALHAQHAALSARVSAFELFINRLRSSLPFRVHRKVHYWLSRGLRNRRPRRRRLYMAEPPGDALLPQKPP